MTAKSVPLSRTRAEEDPRQHLLLDPRPRAEMNRMVMEAMTTTTRSFWVVVSILAFLVFVCLFGAWLYMIIKGMGVAGIRRPTYWGMFIANFVFWIGISHSGTFVSAILTGLQGRIPPPDHPGSGADDRFWPGGSRLISSDPPGACLAGLLDHPISQPALVVA